MQIKENETRLIAYTVSDSEKQLITIVKDFGGGHGGTDNELNL